MTRWVRTREELRGLVTSLKGGTALALDSESDGLHHHVEKVCLIQLAGQDGRCWLVDPLACADLAPLGELLADPAITKVLHGADYDVSTLKRDFGFGFENIFDTMIAARFLGRAEFGLRAVAAAELGVVLSKESQKDDWSRRPLTPLQEEYAAADVRHLLPLHARLEAQLREKGRLPWVQEECRAVAELEPSGRRDGSGAFLRLKGARRLSPRGLAVLRELCAWREARAEETDVPVFKIIGTTVLLELAERAPSRARDVLRVRGLSRLARARADELAAAIRCGQALPESEHPSFPRSPRPVIPDDVKRRIAALRAWRQEQARALELDVAVVLPQRLLEQVAKLRAAAVDDLDAVEGLRRWRVQAFGPALVKVLREL